MKGENPKTYEFQAVGTGEGRKSGRGDTFWKTHTEILKIACDNERQTCYEVLILYGSSRVETIKMSLPTPHPKGTSWTLALAVPGNYHGRQNVYSLNM